MLNQKVSEFVNAITRINCMYYTFKIKLEIVVSNIIQKLVIFPLISLIKLWFMLIEIVNYSL